MIQTTDVGKRIHELRNERGLKQHALARHAGIAHTTMQSIEYGTRNPSLHTLLAIADALSVEPGELFPKAETPSARIPTLAELRDVNAELERLIAWARGHIERWQSEGVSALEDAVVTSYILDRACEQIARDLDEFVPVDEIFNRREEVSEKLIEAANERVQAHRRLLGVSAEARRAAWELSQQADTEAAKGLDKLESLTRTHDEQYA